MGWADRYIDELRQGRETSFRPRGNSMTGKIASGDLVVVRPLTSDPVKGDIVLCRVSGSQYLHLVSAVRNGQYQISNNRGRVNGWTSRDNIYGIVVSVDA